MDGSLLATLLSTLERDPENLELRLHVAGLMLNSGDNEGARAQAARILQGQPDHCQALQLAATASERLGDTQKASAYRRLLDALGLNTAKRLVEDAGLAPFPMEVASDLPDETFVQDFNDLEYWRPVQSDITLDDVAGLSEVKRRLDLSFLGPLRNPEMRTLYGKSLRGGLLLYGPPGCGKTYLARALAGELSAKFLSVGINDVLEMWIGKSERNLHELFEVARRYKPCVLFFDEIDAIGRKRALNRQSAGTTVVNQLLAELDGVASQNDELYIVGATNHPWDVDEALRRPGRLDRTLIVLPPDLEAREAIVVNRMKAKPSDRLAPREIAAMTEDFSGADVAHLCEAATELALEDSIRTGQVRPITMTDFKKARKGMKPSIRPWLESAKNYALFANDGGSYDDLLDYLRARKMV